MLRYLIDEVLLFIVFLNIAPKLHYRINFHLSLDIFRGSMFEAAFDPILGDYVPQLVLRVVPLFILHPDF
jgi:hypothetical protein